MRAHPSAVVIAVTLLACLIGTSRHEQPGPVRATSFELIDATGAVRARLGSGAQQSYLQFMDLDGRPRFVIGFNDQLGGELSIRSRTGSPWAQIQCTDEGSTFQLNSADGKSQVSIESDKAGTRVFLVEGNFPRLKLNASNAGAEVVALNKAGEKLATFMEKHDAGLISAKSSGSDARAIIHASPAAPYFGIFDKAGERARLGMAGGEPAFLIYDKRKVPRFALTLENDSTALSLYDRNRNLRSVIAESNATGQLTLFADDRRPVLSLSSEPEGGRLRLFDAEGDRSERVLLGTFAKGPKLLLSDGATERVLTATESSK